MSIIWIDDGKHLLIDDMIFTPHSILGMTKKLGPHLCYHHRLVDYIFGKGIAYQSEATGNCHRICHDGEQFCK